MVETTEAIYIIMQEEVVSSSLIQPKEWQTQWSGQYGVQESYYIHETCI
jgi:hypothetical protein